MDVKTFKNDVLLIDNFLYQSQVLDTENIIWRDQSKNVKITDKIIQYDFLL